jgi:hypothetical protein
MSVKFHDATQETMIADAPIKKVVIRQKKATMNRLKVA